MTPCRKRVDEVASLLAAKAARASTRLAPSQKYRSKLDTSARNPSKILSVDHQDDGEESSEVRSSVAAARSTLEQRQEAVLVAAQTQKADAELSLRMTNAEAHISALEQKVSERESTRAAEEAANEIESHKNAHSAAFQEIEETEVSCTGQRLQLSKTWVRARQSMAFRWSCMSDMR